MIDRVILLLAVHQAASVNQWYSKQRSEVRFDTFHCLSAPTTAECALQCSHSPECYAFAFNATEGEGCGLVQCVDPSLYDSFTGQHEFYLQAPSTGTSYELLARGKIATMSSTYTSPDGRLLSASYAVDGIYRPPENSETLSVCLTTEEVNPWWRVDLGNTCCVWAVNILNRGDHPIADVRQRARKALITVSNSVADIFYDGNERVLCGYHDGILNQYYTLITCSRPITGQFVQIQLNVDEREYLNLYEVEVHGICQQPPSTESDQGVEEDFGSGDSIDGSGDSEIGGDDSSIADDINSNSSNSSDSDFVIIED